MTKSQETTLKSLLHLACRKRDGNACVKCHKRGKQYKDDDAGTYLQLSHVKSEGAYPRIKYELVNVKLLCWHCHLGSGGWHREPMASTEWFKKTFPDRARKLKDLTVRYYALQKPDYQTIKDELESYLNGD